ncbi:MAG: EAL domain-containing protein [Gallionella sp.]|nr:EAL domain-containing protein [Gallionella sp.]
MEQDKESSRPLPSTDDSIEVVRHARMAGHGQKVDAGAALAATRFPLLRRISITSLLATLITATLLIFLYRQDQLAEHGQIAAQENEKTAIHLIQLMDGQITAYVAATAGLDTQALRTNSGIAPFNAILNTVREHDILKLKLYNPSGVTIFSSVPDDIGGTSRNPEIPKKALASGTQHRLEFRDTFRTPAGDIRDRNILATYVPLTHAEKRIGVLEIYADITPSFDRIYAKTVNIALIIFGAFAALYATLFLSAFRADRAIAEWQKTVADNNRKLTESEARLWTTINSALDAVISIDAESRLIGFNPAAEAMFGWRRAEAIGRTMTELLIPERHRSNHQNGIDRYIKTGETHILNRRIEITALRRDGTEFPIELTITPIREGDRVIFTAYIRDITERKHAEDELRESRAFHQSVTEAMGEIGIGLFIVDTDYRVRYMNAVMKEWFGDQTGRTCYSSIGGATGQCAHCQIEQVLIEKATTRYTPVMPDGRAFDIIATPIQNRDGTISKLEVIRDVTEHRLAEQELRIAAKAFESQEGMFITSANGIIERVNKAFIEITGYSAEEVVGKTAVILKSGRHDAAFYQAIRNALESDGYWQGEIWNRRKNGEIYPEWQTISAVRGTNEQVTHYVSAFADISQRKQSEEQIHSLAFYDPLTQLPNRRLLLDRLHQALALSVRTDRQGALLFIDLDNFKSINDTQGHAVGDLLLIEVAKRLQGCIREGDTTARLGGDEFVVLLEDLDEDEQAAAAQAEAAGEKIREILGQPCLINGHEQHSTASIGITLFRGPVRTMEEMLKRADVALYQAKAEGRNTVRFFDPAMQTAVSARVALESDLRRAVSEQEQFLLYYQPQVDSSGRMIGAEALVRWRHPERGMVSPADFIPLAEESGLILPLGHWVMATACEQLAAWAAQPEMAHLTLAVNVSAKQFHLPTFVEEVLALVDYFGVNPARLKLEITESLLLDNVDDIIAKMTALKTRGISFSMDDFGTGYSSLSYLKRLPLYQLKIDQSFVRDVLTDPNDAAIAKTIIALAQSMNLAVIAEGVETEAQRKFLELNDCHTFQGYLFSKPVPVKEFEQLIAKYA